MEHAEAIRIFYRHTSAASAQAPGPGETDIGATAQTMKTGISRFAKKAEGLKAPVLIFHPPKAAYHCTPQGGGGGGALILILECLCHFHRHQKQHILICFGTRFVMIAITVQGLWFARVRMLQSGVVALPSSRHSTSRSQTPADAIGAESCAGVLLRGSFC